jgi:ABC-type antimicrobial peptide transport system permease subunit
VAPVFLDSTAYSGGARVRAYYDELFTRIGRHPGVTAVGGGTTAPASLLGPDFDRPVWPVETGGDPAHRLSAAVRIVTPGYFPALGLNVVEGRAIAEGDRPDHDPVAVVNESLARRVWPDGAVGRQLVVDYSSAGTYAYDVVGVVADVRFDGPRVSPPPEIYLAHAQRSYLTLNVVIRTSGDVQALVPVVRSIMQDLDPGKPPQSIRPLTELLGATYARDRQAAIALGLFAVGAIILAILNVYGALAQQVRERMSEIGVRLALGADAGRVAMWVAGTGLRLVAVGLVVGLVLAWSATGALSHMLFGVQATDLRAMGGAAITLGVAGLAATVLPAWRAARVDPVSVLRRLS